MSSVGMWIGTAKRAGLPEAHVVQQHDDNIRSTLRGCDFEKRRRLDVAGIEFGDHRQVVVQE